jgi:hypothetical protein
MFDTDALLPFFAVAHGRQVFTLHRGYYPNGVPSELSGDSPTKRSLTHTTLPAGVISVCPAVNRAEDILCFTPTLGTWYHKGADTLSTCESTAARMCCSLHVAGQARGAEWNEIGCDGCNFVTSFSDEACAAMYRPDKGLQPCVTACAQQTGVAAL